MASPEDMMSAAAEPMEARTGHDLGNRTKGYRGSRITTGMSRSVHDWYDA